MAINCSGAQVGNVVVESALNVTRLARTVRAARAYSRSALPPTIIPDSCQYNMRQSMSLGPRVGKFTSRVALRTPVPNAWSLVDPKTSNFINPEEVEAAVRGVKEDGFYVFRALAPIALVEAIRKFAETVPCEARGAGRPLEIYPRSNPQVGRYDIHEKDTLGCPEAQDFVTDPALALVAQRYLGQPVVMDEVAFWWTTTKRAEDANLNAQLFHQDRDRLSFLKFFMYLTDVDTSTGPHVYVKGSHRRIPWTLRFDGRIDDAAVRGAGLWDQVVELTGPAGTIMAVDTIGLHKGKTPISADRLALENEFATSLFGSPFERPSFTPTDLAQYRIKEMPWVLQRYVGS